MKSDVTPQAATPAEAKWVEAQLLSSLLRASHETQVVGLFVAPIFIAVLWDNARTLALLLWVACSAALALARFAIMRKYEREVMTAGAWEHLAFFGRYGLLWPVSAFVWGWSTLLFFAVAPLADQFVCWLLLAGLAMFSVNSLSAHLPTFRRWIDTLSLTCLAVVLWQIGVELRFQGPLHHYSIAALVVVFWQVLRQAGLRLHQTHRRNFELQYRNNELIESLKRQTQAALDAVGIKNRFLASAAHDIRQPVHALGLYADWLSSDPEMVHQLAPKIVESTKAVNALFDSLFDLVRLDTGKIKLNIEPVDLYQMLYELDLHYRPLAQAKGLELRMHAAPGCVMSDGILLRRIVGNLISNAIKYTQQGGVLVAWRPHCTQGRIEVWDTGLGIDPAYQRDVFREFFKVPGHPGTEDGFGLGLHIVARLSTILGHPVALASRPGRGTVFRVMLQPTDARQAAERASAAVDQLVSMP
jgi:signal transduction histidine kinase